MFHCDVRVIQDQFKHKQRIVSMRHYGKVEAFFIDINCNINLKEKKYETNEIKINEENN